MVPVYVTNTMPARSRDVTGDGRLMERVRFLRAGLVIPSRAARASSPPALRPGCGVLRLSAIDGAGNAGALSFA